MPNATSRMNRNFDCIVISSLRVQVSARAGAIYLASAAAELQRQDNLVSFVSHTFSTIALVLRLHQVLSWVRRPTRSDVESLEAAEAPRNARRGMAAALEGA